MVLRLMDLCKMAKKSFSLHVFIPVSGLNHISLDDVLFLLYIHALVTSHHACPGHAYTPETQFR